DYGPMPRMLPPAHGPRSDDEPRQFVDRLLRLASRMSPRQLATSRRTPKAAQAKGYVEGSLARSHVATARVLKQAAGKRP
ncbi:MAG: IS4 family transposase, partial [Xenophilus sp.]